TLKLTATDIRPDAGISTVDHAAFGSPSVADVLEQSTTYRAARSNASADIIEGLGYTAIHIAAAMSEIDKTLAGGLKL
ncbi:MAG: hypothetical protein ABJA94_01295, partial [Rhodoglobus sp.]